MSNETPSCLLNDSVEAELHEVLATWESAKSYAQELNYPADPCG